VPAVDHLVEDRTAALPDLVVEDCGLFLERAETPLEQLAMGRDSRRCEALLTFGTALPVPAM
jgi:hypothetical protein